MQHERTSGLPTPHAGQQRILDLNKRFKVAVCGRRFGKTVAAAIAAVTRCEQIKDTRVWWISPVQEQSDRVEREVAFWLRERMKGRGVKGEDGKPLVDPTLVWQHRITEHALVHENTSRIEFHSAESGERLRGAGLDLVVIDEAADVSEYTWNVVLKPMLLERHGDAILTGTPRGKNHWLHRLYLLGQNKDEAACGGYGSIKLPTRANPEITEADLKDFRADMTAEMFQQEFEAEFIDGVETVFAGAKECIGGAALECGRPGARYVTGIDLGQKLDFTVLCSIACDSKKVEGFARFNEMDWRTQEKQMLGHLQRFPGPAVVDATGVGGPIYEFLREEQKENVERFVFTAQSRAEILTELQRAISHRSLVLANVQALIDELNAFTMMRDEQGLMNRTKMAAPSGMHDDCVMALALAWKGILMPRIWEPPLTVDNFAKDGMFAGPNGTNLSAALAGLR